jgi:hypothetical protein
VNKAMTKLKTKYPAWDFSAEFGANLLLPPLPLANDDDKKKP